MLPSVPKSNQVRVRRPILPHLMLDESRLGLFTVMSRPGRIEPNLFPTVASERIRKERVAFYYRTLIPSLLAMEL